MSEKRREPPEIPVETEPTWEDLERVARRILTTPPKRKHGTSKPKGR